MPLPDDETLAEEVLEEPTSAPDTPVMPTQTEIESGMDTGQGADDEPEMTIGDRLAPDAEQVSPEKARRLLGDENG